MSKTGMTTNYVCKGCKVGAGCRDGIYEGDSNCKARLEIYAKNHEITKFLNRKKLLDYSKSWDSLIPVIKKIDGIMHSMKTTDTDKRQCNKFEVELFQNYLSFDKEEVFKSCVKFIKWYKTLVRK